MSHNRNLQEGEQTTVKHRNLDKDIITMLDERGHKQKNAYSMFPFIESLEVRIAVNLLGERAISDRGHG